MASLAQRIANSPVFQGAIVLLILTSGLISGVESYLDERNPAHESLATIQDVILGVFVVEI